MWHYRYEDNAAKLITANGCMNLRTHLAKGLPGEVLLRLTREGDEDNLIGKLILAGPTVRLALLM